jgi:hypothetical protein
MVRLLDSHSGAFFACCKADSADENGRVYLANPERYKGSFWPPDEPCLFDRTCLPRLLRANFCICTTGVYRAECVRRIGPVDEQHNFAGDWQYWARGLIAGYTIVGTHRPLVHYRRHAHAMTRQYAANFYRFQDELDVIRWIAEEGHRHGLLSTPVPDYGLVRNTLMSEYAARLAAGDRENADRLLDFAGERVPGFRGSAYDRLARGARRLGRAGGAGLRALESAYLWLLARGERRPAITVAATPESPPGAAP